jgi:hypothetical protein
MTVIRQLPPNYGSQPQLMANLWEGRAIYSRMPDSWSLKRGVIEEASPYLVAQPKLPPMKANSGIIPDASAVKLTKASIFGDDYSDNAQAGLAGFNLIIVLAVVGGLAALAVSGRA